MGEKTAYHYTTIETLEKIIVHKTLLFSDLKMMNDPHEIDALVKSIQAFIIKEVEDDFDEYIKDIDNGKLKKEKLKAFVVNEKVITKFIEYVIKTYSFFALSTSTNRDSLPMWNYYAHSTGVNFSIELEQLKENCFSHLNCYDLESSNSNLCTDNENSVTVSNVEYISFNEIIGKSDSEIVSLGELLSKNSLPTTYIDAMEGFIKNMCYLFHYKALSDVEAKEVNDTLYCEMLDMILKRNDNYISPNGFTEEMFMDRKKQFFQLLNMIIMFKSDYYKFEEEKRIVVMIRKADDLKQVESKICSSTSTPFMRKCLNVSLAKEPTQFFKSFTLSPVIHNLPFKKDMIEDNLLYFLRKNDIEVDMLDINIAYYPIRW